MKDLYQEFIHKSRYARFLTDKNRRENWNETVERYFNFMENHLKDNFKYDLKPHRSELETFVKEMNVMPSMRCMMSAGPALERDHTAGYNCSYVAVDDEKSFDEAMHILLCGTGVGFSVERQYVNQLPEVPERLFDSDTIIIVKDSKEGWAKGFRQLISLLYAGEIPKWDLFRIRPAGSRLKIFGGRASGPGPLDDLFRFTVAIFRNAQGRKLTSLECHDIMCKIGEAVVVGGVRRSAMISLSNLFDDRMRHAKSGEWYKIFPHRTLSNNSAVYTEKPEVGMFMREWLSLFESNSGERGIFNREASKIKASSNGRRDPNYDFGTNPCSEIILRPNQFCNLTEVVVRAKDSQNDLEHKVKLATMLGTFQATLTHFPYLRKAWIRNTEEERLLGVSLTGILDNRMLNNYADKKLPQLLETLRQVAINTNQQLSETLGIPQSTAITCVKPSGTVSQLVNSASGIHPRHSRYYIRRIRADIKDPLTQFMMNAGIPHEPDVVNPNSIMVFSFPRKSPDTALTRNDLPAIDHLKLWLVYQKHWCEHKPSVTISVKEKEWPSIGAWVWDNFDEISGVSFLPYDGGLYRQAPYEEINKEQYDEFESKMPKSIDWDSLVENDDNVEGTQTLACSSAMGCEL
jgi:ribonucleoside-triphosphate reductase (thioredoxin)